MIKRKDLLLIAAFACIAAVVILLSNRGTRRISTEEPSASAEPAAYLLAAVGSVQYAPVPLTSEGDHTIRQQGGEVENIVHVTADSIAMASSTCDNQDCVEQGTVTLDNRNARLLGNMIICLPNQVMLELITAEEAQEMIIE